MTTPQPGDGSARDEADQQDRLLMLRIARDQDAAAMRALYEQYRPRLVGFLRRLTRDDALIEEAYNDVMVKVWDKAEQYQARAKVSSWIFSIAYRTCLRMVKKQQRTNLLFESTDAALSELAAPDFEPNLDKQQIHRALLKLSSKHRLVVELCYFEGYSIDEIGQIVECPANTVKTRLHHARKKIREVLEREARSFGQSVRGF